MKEMISVQRPERISLHHLFYGACAVVGTILVVILPTFYFPYMSNDGYAELYAFNPGHYFGQAVADGRVLRYFVLNIYSHLVNSSAHGLLVVRVICLGFFVLASLGLYFAFVRYYRWRVLHAVAFLAVFVSMQSSQIQLAWEDLAVHSFLFCLVIGSYYLGLLYPVYHARKQSTLVLAWIGSFVLLVISGFTYPVIGYISAALLIGHLLFRSEDLEHAPGAALTFAGIFVASQLTLIAGAPLISAHYGFRSEGNLAAANINTTVDFLKTAFKGAVLIGDVAFAEDRTLIVGIVLLTVCAVLFDYKNRTHVWSFAVKWLLVITGLVFVTVPPIMKGVFPTGQSILLHSDFCYSVRMVSGALFALYRTAPLIKQLRCFW